MYIISAHELLQPWYIDKFAAEQRQESKSYKDIWEHT